MQRSQHVMPNVLVSVKMLWLNTGNTYNRKMTWEKPNIEGKFRSDFREASFLLQIIPKKYANLTQKAYFEK